MKLKNNLIIFLILWLSFFNQSDTIGCTCKYLSDTVKLQQRINDHDIIFTGRLWKAEIIKDNLNLDNKGRMLVKYTFKINKFYKIDEKQNSDQYFVLYQRLGNCMFPFRVAERYLVYAYKESEVYYTSQCSPSTGILDAKAHLNLLSTDTGFSNDD